MRRKVTKNKHQKIEPNNFKKVKELGSFSQEKRCQRNDLIMAFSKKYAAAKMQIYFFFYH